ncbi:MFS transporter [Nocardioides sp. LML1-1-1.1]|uniref:MFS transporter n=1 Tax=Nocardioides sp. LML1-1-1.1 TaxID=3135248 RepID=UPI003431F97C
MSADAVAATPVTGVTRLWRRELHHYPAVRTRIVCLSIVVLATVLFYYQYYVVNSVSENVLTTTGMSFMDFVWINVISVAASALASLAAGITDRYGRANLVTAGVLGCSLVCLFGLTNAHSTFAVGFWFAVLGALEGVVLVATPALVRDFSPQLGRASAMGFWTLGPVLGSLVSTVVVSSTPHLDAWQDQYWICGLAGLVVFVIALLWLRELSPQLRDQVLVSEKDLAIVEARARGIDVEAATTNPLRQMMRLDILGSAVGISLFFFIYYVAVSFFPLFFQVVLGYTESRANSLMSWMWAAQAVSLVVVGVLSDRLRVRKPFMLVGAIGAAIGTIGFIRVTASADTSYTTFAVWLSVMAISLGMGFAPWMASYTETVEDRNPALVATGLSLWGLTIRSIAAAAIILGPTVVTTVNTLVNDGPRVQGLASTYSSELATAALLTPATTAALTASPDDPMAQAQAVSEISGKSVDVVGKVITLGQKYDAQLATLAAIDPKTQTALLGDPNDQQAQVTAVEEIAKGFGISAARATGRLMSLAAVPPADLAFLDENGGAVQDAGTALQALGEVPADDLTYLQERGPAVQQAVDDAPGQWRKYFWMAVVGELLFIPFIFLMAGYWDPRRARKHAAEHDRRVAAELAALQGRPE